MSNFNTKEEFAELKIGDKIVKLPIKRATIGQDVIDISKLYNESGYLTYDPGFMSTASCESKITYIDGDQGILRHRGYNASELANKCDFLEVAYLLLHGDLPNMQEFSAFEDKIKHHTMVHEQLHQMFRGYKRSAHPMSIMVGAVGSLSSFYKEYINISSEHDSEMAAIRIIAKIPTLAAMSYKYTIGQPFVYPKNSLSFCENFLRMMFANPCEEYQVNKVLSSALNKIFILHADHEQNASTSTVRLAGSSGANPLACISAGIASLWGHAHGGANEAVINMLNQIGSPDKIPEFINSVKNKANNIRLMGFGHRVYKNYDPRAYCLRDTCKEVLETLGKKDNKLLEIAMELEKVALQDDYFVQRKLYPNVDFYSGIIYEAMGIPSSMFTVLFAVARTAGWMSQWKEMIEDPNQKIGRPRQLYLGHTERNFTEMRDR